MTFDPTLIDTIAARASTGSLSRRRFMEGVLASGLPLSLATTLWSTRVAAATPVRGGTFRVGLDDAGTTDSLDPASTSSMYMIQLGLRSAPT